MAFKLRSGNKTPFKMMGSYSPMKENGKTKTKEQAKKTTSKKKTREEYLNEGFSQREADQMYKNQATTGYDTQKDWEPAYEGADYSQEEINKMTRKEKETKIDGYDPKLDKTIPKPKKSTTSKHGQLSDAEAEYETDKKLYDKYMEGKKKKKSSPNKNKAEDKYKDPSKKGVSDSAEQSSKSKGDGGSVGAKKSNRDTGGSTGSRKSGRMDLKKLKKLAEKGAKEATTTTTKGKEQSGESPAKQGFLSYRPHGSVNPTRNYPVEIENVDKINEEKKIKKEAKKKLDYRKSKLTLNKKSPAKNYKNPQDYKVFNMGNKPTPVKKHKKY